MGRETEHACSSRGRGWPKGDEVEGKEEEEEEEEEEGDM